MSTVYSGSLINIAASAATNSDGGLFVTRDPLEITPCVVSGCNSELGWQDQPCAVWATEEHVAGTPLNKRDWVFQERLLAPKTVHFTETRIFLQCPHILALETDPSGQIDLIFEGHLTGDWSVPPPKNLPVASQAIDVA